MENVIRNAIISREEAAEFIQSDIFDIYEAHQGFLIPSKYPFNKPLHYPGNIILYPPVDIHPAAEIGDGVVIGRYTNICGGDVVVGENSRIQGFCFIPPGIEIGKYVFIGPGVIFTNTKYPRAYNQNRERPLKTIIEDYASIGAGAIICPGVRIGSRSLVGAGAIVTKDVPPNMVVIGGPARKLKEM